MYRILLLVLALLIFASCKSKSETMTKTETPFVWEGANLYFLLTDRFNNANPDNDLNFDRDQEAAKFRGFMGGDLKGITQKIEEGYFDKLGINAIWMSPIVEQIHSAQDEGTGSTYGYHGYWTKDWTQIDPNFGTEADLKELVQTARKHGIKILLDAVINHTGPATEKDPVWPSDWVRTEPKCSFEDYNSTVTCTLVDNLPDILTESDKEVALPPQLVEKWKAEGRYQQEVKELDDWFAKTGHPRAPRFYIMKWLTDYIREFGFEGYRVDTVKHVEESVWQEFKTECDRAYAAYKAANPDESLHPYFYLVGEVYNYGVSTGQLFDFGDKKVNYFDKSFHSLINFEFKYDADRMSYGEMFEKYDSILQNDLKEYGTLNYLTSHDDGSPYDKTRKKGMEAATRLLLSPGTSQTYYGDESNRKLDYPKATGDATLRSPMNWDEMEDPEVKALLAHFGKLGNFRKNHPAVGAGKHAVLQDNPLVFKRTYSGQGIEDEVIVGLELPEGSKSILVDWPNGTQVNDAYSNVQAEVIDGKVVIESDATLVLLEKL